MSSLMSSFLSWNDLFNFFTQKLLLIIILEGVDYKQ